MVDVVQVQFKHPVANSQGGMMADWLIFNVVTKQKNGKFFWPELRMAVTSDMDILIG